jgi:cytidylate kinase
MIISIGRECGSGGHEIGEKLAAMYGLKLYDKNLIGAIAAHTGKDADYLVKLEEKVKSGILPVQRDGFAAHRHELMSSLTKTDRFFLLEKDLILTLAGKESFVLIGHAGNAILADNPDTLKLYVYASEEFKIPRVKERFHLDTDKEAIEKMKQVDKERKAYFEYYSDKAWGTNDAHDFMIDTSVFGIDGAVEIINGIIKKKFGV